MCFMNEVNDCMQQGPGIILKNNNPESQAFSCTLPDLLDPTESSPY